jgi:hypothetical protein
MKKKSVKSKERFAEKKFHYLSMLDDQVTEEQKEWMCTPHYYKPEENVTEDDLRELEILKVATGGTDETDETSEKEYGEDEEEELDFDNIYVV